MPSDYRPRLSVEISSEQFEELKDLIPWGLRRQLFETIVNDVIRLTKKHGQHFIAAILTGAVRLEDYSSMEVPKDANK